SPSTLLPYTTLFRSRSARPHQHWLNLPVLPGLELSPRSRRPRIRVVDEGDSVADEDVVFDRHAFADEGVARNLASPPDLRILVALDDRPDIRFVADITAVPVDALREFDALRQSHVDRSATVCVHRRSP